MRVPREPPERIAHLVDCGPGEVTFASATKPGVLIGIGGAVGVVLAWLGIVVLGRLAGVDGAFTRFLFDAPGSLLLFGALGAAAGGGLGSVVASRPRTLTVTSDGLRYGGVLPPRAERPTGLVLTGKPGRAMRLESDVGVLAELVPSPSARGWDFDSATWLGDRVATLLGVGLRDDRPEAEWRRWASDPLFRAEKEFDARLADNRARFHEHHGTEPSAPAHRIEVDGMEISVDPGLFRSTTLRITPTHLVLEDRRIRLDAITRAGVEYRDVKTKNRHTWHGRLMLLVDGRAEEVLDLRVDSDGGKRAATLNWLAPTILEHARAARDLGDEGEVPADLARMVRPVAEGR